MTEGRRHSVDVPLSKALVALKRVRSLRDPDTNSMDKFSMFIESLNWETNSASDPILKLNDHSDQAPDRARISDRSDAESIRSSRFLEIKPSSRKISRRHQHSPDEFEEEVLAKINGRTRKKTAQSALKGPYLSPINSSIPSPTAMGLFDEEPDAMDSSQSGCGLGSCWSRTPRFKDQSCFSDEEEQSHPFLRDEMRKNSAYREMNSYAASPRSLNQKYRPRSFDDLIGLPVVVQSLANAICRGKIFPVYLFHGPPGTGKTSTARIFAAGMNCLSLGEKIPCGICRECVSFFSGKSRCIKELDPATVNSRDKAKAFIKRASLAPFSSNYRVFIIDESHTLHADAWIALSNSIQELSSRVVFIMITSDLEKLSHVSLSSCQRYQFPKIKDADIVRRLQKISAAEGMDFEDDALAFIAARSNGSLREAETMLDQLGLLGKRITVSLARELAGVVSEDELLDLLDLALSADTRNTVRRARELMSAKIDPLQLTSQLANLIMDILAGRCRPEDSADRSFFRSHAAADAGLRKLRNALRVLSETDKQLRSSKNRATWLTVALLQLNADDSPDVDDSSSTLVQASNVRKEEPLSRSLSARESVQSSICEGQCGGATSRRLDAIWRRTIECCQSDLPKNFLKKGRLTAISLKQGLAIAQVEFSSPELVARAEASWKAISCSLQLVLCRSVELRVSLARCSSFSKAKELTYRLLGCSGKRQGSLGGCAGKMQRSGGRLEEDSGRVSDKGRPFLLLLPGKGSLETFLCHRVPFIFCSRGASSRQTKG